MKPSLAPLITLCALTSGGCAQTPVPSADTPPQVQVMAEKASTALQDDYWLKYGMAGLYDGQGQWQRLLRVAGPYKIFETRDALVKISDAEDHWVRRVDISLEPPLMRPDMKTKIPDRPVTQFPDALEEEARRRGIEMKDERP